MTEAMEQTEAVEHHIRVHLDELLVRRGMSMKELAETVGIHPNNLSRLKHGHVTFIKFTTLGAICRVLDCEVGDLLSVDKD